MREVGHVLKHVLVRAPVSAVAECEDERRRKRAAAAALVVEVMYTARVSESWRDEARRKRREELERHKQHDSNKREERREEQLEQQQREQHQEQHEEQCQAAHAEPRTEPCEGQRQERRKEQLQLPQQSERAEPESSSGSDSSGDEENCELFGYIPADEFDVPFKLALPSLLPWIQSRCSRLFCAELNSDDWHAEDGERDDISRVSVLCDNETDVELTVWTELSEPSNDTSYRVALPAQATANTSYHIFRTAPFQIHCIGERRIHSTDRRSSPRRNQLAGPTRAQVTLRESLKLTPAK
mmetsp:Transcript_458/g.1197  ORF Transcript_458/g.1197 Transcript_458/m.1197 type:complete len:298 (-) Transcript_458:1538-2431(-)